MVINQPKLEANRDSHLTSRSARARVSSHSGSHLAATSISQEVQCVQGVSFKLNMDASFATSSSRNESQPPELPTSFGRHTGRLKLFRLRELELEIRESESRKHFLHPDAISLGHNSSTTKLGIPSHYHLKAPTSPSRQGLSARPRTRYLGTSPAA